MVSIEFVCRNKEMLQFYSNDGIKCCIFALSNYVEYLSSNPKVSIIDEMIIKTLINLVYSSLYYFSQGQ